MNNIVKETVVNLNEAFSGITPDKRMFLLDEFIPDIEYIQNEMSASEGDDNIEFDLHHFDYECNSRSYLIYTLCEIEQFVRSEWAYSRRMQKFGIDIGVRRQDIFILSEQLSLAHYCVEAIDWQNNKQECFEESLKLKILHLFVEMHSYDGCTLPRVRSMVDDMLPHYQHASALRRVFEFAGKLGDCEILDLIQPLKEALTETE